MLISGVLTSTMIYAAIAPQAMLMSTFGETLEGPLAETIVRSWGALIALVGGMLVAAAYHPPSRPLAAIAAAVSKATFIGLVLAQGDRFLQHGAGIAVVTDGVMVALLAAYLVGVTRRGAVRDIVA